LLKNSPAHDWTVEDMESLFEAYDIDADDAEDYAEGAQKFPSICPFDASHSKGSACFYLFVGNDGKKYPVFSCSHDSCTTAKFNGWAPIKKFLRETRPEVAFDWHDTGTIVAPPVAPTSTSTSPAPEAPEVITPRKSQRMSYEDLINEAKQFEDTPDIVEGILKRGTVNIGVGDSTLGKTPFFFQEGLCVSHGGPFIGQKVNRGRVLICDYENHGDAIDFLKSISEHLKIGKPDPDWIAYVRHLSLEDLTWEIEDFKPVLCIIDSLRGFDPAAEQGNTEAAQMITRLQRIAQKCDSAFQVIHHPRKHNQSLKTDERPNLFDLDRPVADWLQESSGALALINQTHTRLGFQKPPKGTHKGTDLGVRGSVKARGDTGLIHLHREYNDFGQPIGYDRVTGEDQLSDEDKSLLNEIPVGKPMRFTEILKLWERGICFTQVTPTDCGFVFALASG
jgi:AAA domain